MSQSVTYEAFKEVFENEVMIKFGEEKAKEIFSKVDWDDWLYKPGHPTIQIDFSNKFIDEAKLYSEKTLKGEYEEGFYERFNKWHTCTKVVFLDYLLQAVDINNPKSQETIFLNLQKKLSLNTKYNVEVTYVWLQIALKLRFPIIEEVDDFLGRVGRMKWLKPLYLLMRDFDRNKGIQMLNKHK